MSKELSVRNIQSDIIHLPGRPPFMMAQTLAVIYEVQVKRINQAVKRNPRRFPPDFCFQLTDIEWENLRCQIDINNSGELDLRSQIVTSSCDGSDLRFQNGTSSHGGVRYIPYGFTREGANQLSTVLHSLVAIERSIQIMRAFSEMERRAQAETERQARALKRQGEREWQQTRYISKEQRKEFTDTIRDILLPHARSQGSTAPEDKIYMSYSKMIKGRLFAEASSIPKDYRDQLTIRQLNIIAVAEFIADGAIQEEVGKGTHYKGKDSIFEKVKAKIIQYAATVGILQLGEPERLVIGDCNPAALEDRSRRQC